MGLGAEGKEGEGELQISLKACPTYMYVCTVTHIEH